MMRKKFPIFILVLVLGFYSVGVQAVTITTRVTIAYAEETHQIDTTQSFTETLLNPNGSSLDTDLPADVLSTGEAVELTMYSTLKENVTTDKPLPSGKLGADIFYSISFKKVSDSSTVSSFDKAITLIFYYTDSDISGIDESTLTAYRWNGSNWTALSDSAVDTSLNKVTATTSAFSFFGIFGEEEEAGPSCGDGSCNGDETCSSCPTDCGSCPSSGGGGGGFFRRIFKPTPEPKPTSVPKPTSDFNKDSKVNIIDLSILLFWFGKTGPEIVPYDLNKDNKIDIVDVSILFYHWKD